MSDYYDSDDDDVFRAKSVRVKVTGSSGSRYGAWEQSELERHMFSWTLHDVLNKNLLKKKVKKSAFSASPFILIYLHLTQFSLIFACFSSRTETYVSILFLILL